MGRKINKIVNFIPEYASHLMNRLVVGKDGKVKQEAYDPGGGVWGETPIRSITNS